MVSDRVGDFIVRLQNAAAVGKSTVSLSYSKHLEDIARKLKQLGFVESVSKESKDDSVKKTLVVVLASDERGGAKVHGVARISKPGRRLYLSHRNVHGVKGGVGARIVSTPKGILSDAEARKARVGGENLFEIW